MPRPASLLPRRRIVLLLASVLWLAASVPCAYALERVAGGGGLALGLAGLAARAGGKARARDTAKVATSRTLALAGVVPGGIPTTLEMSDCHPSQMNQGVGVSSGPATLPVECGSARPPVHLHTIHADPLQPMDIIPRMEAQELPASQTYEKSNGELEWNGAPGSGKSSKKDNMIPLADEDETEVRWRRRR